MPGMRPSTRPCRPTNACVWPNKSGIAFSPAQIRTSANGIGRTKKNRCRPFPSAIPVSQRLKQMFQRRDTKKNDQKTADVAIQKVETSSDHHCALELLVADAQRGKDALNIVDL